MYSGTFCIFQISALVLKTYVLTLFAYLSAIIVMHVALRYLQNVQFSRIGCYFWLYKFAQMSDSAVFI